MKEDRDFLFNKISADYSKEKIGERMNSYFNNGEIHNLGGDISRAENLVLIDIFDRLILYYKEMHDFPLKPNDKSELISKLINHYSPNN
jgi:hypothetical protein